MSPFLRRWHSHAVGLGAKNWPEAHSPYSSLYMCMSTCSIGMIKVV